MTREKRLPEPEEPNPDEEVPDDFSGFKEGATFPKLNKKIYFLFVNGGDYIVFLDEQLILHRYYNSIYAEGGFAKDYGEIVVRHANLEATSVLLLKGLQLEVFRKLLGESIARVIEDRHSRNARRMLREAEEFLNARSREWATLWYLSATIGVAVLAIIAGNRAWVYRESVAASLGFGVGAVALLLGAAAGSFGAMLSVMLRSKKLCIDFSAGWFVHFFEGTLRVLVGASAGFLFALTLKSDVLLGALTKSERPMPLMLLVCIIAGASERRLPSLIKQLEGTLVGHVGKAKLGEEAEQEEEEEEEEEEAEEEDEEIEEAEEAEEEEEAVEEAEEEIGAEEEAVEVVLVVEGRSAWDEREEDVNAGADGEDESRAGARRRV